MQKTFAFIAYGICPGGDPREICRFETRPGEGLSVNRADGPQPSKRASELEQMVCAGRFTHEEIKAKTKANIVAQLARARAMRRKRLDV